jgi:hypothetical protein
MSDRALAAVAASLRPGVAEVMVHPGVTDDDRPFDNGYRWTGDLAAVTRYTRAQFEERFSLRLVSYGEAWA